MPRIRCLPLLSCLLVTALAGCVRYQARPLDTAPGWSRHPHTSDGKPLRRIDLQQATRRALHDNADYRAALDDARISTLQLHAAGLLPDPQFGLTLDHPTNTGYTRGYTMSLSEDLHWLLTRGADVDAARARATATRLQLAWQGWSLAQRTAADYVALWLGQRRCALLSTQVTRLQARRKAWQKVLANGHATLQAGASQLTALSDLQAQLELARQTRDDARARFNQDLRFAPAVKLTLAPPPTAALPAPTQLQHALKALPNTRPDLMALAAGYHAADADFRSRVLAQFPGLSVSVNRASDTSNVHTTGIGITLDLPLFGRTRQAARLARATRDQLHARYRARLEAANAQAQALYVRLRHAAQRQHALASQLPPLRRLASRADRAFATGHYPAASWLALHQDLLARELEALDVRATLAQGRVALAALLGQAPSATSPTSSHHSTESP